MRIGVNARLIVGQPMEGIPRYIFETTIHMARAHSDDEFILFFDRKVNLGVELPYNVKTVVVPWHARHPVIWHIWLEYMLPFYFKWYQIDVFYSGDGYMSQKSEIPTLLVIHDLAYVHYPEHIKKSSLQHYQKYLPKYVDAANRIISVSHFVKNDLIQHFGIDPAKIKVAYNAVSQDDHSDKHSKIPYSNSQLNDHPYFLYVGAIHPRKNILKLIRAFVKFNASSSQKYKLVLAGRMAWKTEEIAQAIANSEDVIYMGMVSEGVKNQLLAHAVAVAYISLFEGFGIPILEAMGHGTPVITSSVTSMPEVAGEAAILVDPESEDEIAHAMKTICEDQKVRRYLTKAGMERCKFFTWAKSADIIYKELKWLL
ncbi:MAG: glycosyltransferase family 1 protein [Saprospiraceae bacterium]